MSIVTLSHADWILRNTQLVDQAHPHPVDIAIKHGKITAIAPNLPMTAEHEWNLAGRIVLPGFVDLHTHLDKTYFDIPNHSGTLLEAIEVWRSNKQRGMRTRVRTNASRALRTAISRGTAALRTHVDVEVMSDLVSLEALLEVRGEFHNKINLEIVALASPVRTETAEAALKLGCDLIGGAPALEADPYANVADAFVLAEKYGKAIDLHIDETEDPNMRTLERLAELTLAHGMQGRVTAGHCCSLDFMDEATASRVIEKVAKAQINVITLPSCNLVLMGRSQRPVPRGLTRVKQLLAAGVNVCIGSDNVRDPFNPLGNYDLLHSANLTAHAAHMTGSDEILSCLRMVSQYPAQVMGLGGQGIMVGTSADLVVMDTTEVGDLLPSVPARLATVKAGFVTRIERNTDF